MKNDAPIFDPDQWQLTQQQAELSALARDLGQSKFSERAFEYDKNATFPTENFKDFQSLHPSLIGLDKRELPYAGISAPLHPGATRYYKEARLLR